MDPTLSVALAAFLSTIGSILLMITAYYFPPGTHRRIPEMEEDRIRDDRRGREDDEVEDRRSREDADTRKTRRSHDDETSRRRAREHANDEETP